MGQWNWSSLTSVHAILPAKRYHGTHEQGPLTGSYARDVRVCVYDGKMHPVDSNEVSFMLAGRNAFSAAFKNAGPKILEPVYDVEVSFRRITWATYWVISRPSCSDHGHGQWRWLPEAFAGKVPLKEMSTYSLSELHHGRTCIVHHDVY